MTERNIGFIRALRRFKPYPSYKDSGIEWVGKIPSHWITKRIRYVAPALNERVYYANFDRTYLALEHIESETGKLLSESIPQEVDSTTSLFKPGDVLFGKLRPYLAKVLLCDCSGACSTELLVLRSNGEIYPANLAYQLRSRGFIRWIDSMTYGTKMPRANPEQVMNTRIIIASPKEQRAIASFLDRETAKIDALIEKKERLIELLQEKRTALINQAVTKSLDPTVPMKDSGVEWLGNIPAHWIVTTLKRIGNLQAGAGFPNVEQGHQSEDIPFFKVGDMGTAGNERKMIECQNTISRAIATKLHAFIYPVKTIVFAKVGAALLLNRRRILIKPSCIDNNMMGLIPTSCDPIWALYWLSGLDMSELANPGAVPSVNERQMRDTPVVLPPLYEQRAIAAFLDQETAKIDALAAKIHEAIDRLKEYRTALISSAITGKINLHGDFR